MGRKRKEEGIRKNEAHCSFTILQTERHAGNAIGAGEEREKKTMLEKEVTKEEIRRGGKRQTNIPVLFSSGTNTSWHG